MESAFRRSAAPPPVRPQPAAVFLATLIGVVGVVSLSSLPVLAAALGAVFAAAVTLARGVRPLAGALWVLPFGGLLAVVLPFVTPGPPRAFVDLGPWQLAATATGLTRGLALFLRLTGAALLMTAVSRRLGVTALLEALDGLRVPPLFRALIAFTLRYAEVLSDEGRRMVVARRARGFRVRRQLLDLRAIRTYGALLGVLFVRARERSERVYLAMLSRGYRLGPGEVRPAAPFASAADCLVPAAALLLVTAFKAFDLKLWK